MPNSKQIVYLSQAQYAELIANGSITVDGVTVTYDENDIYVTPQAEPVTDVRVAGTSVTSNGVANIPVMSSSNFGVAKVGDFGVGIGTGGLSNYLVTVPASSTYIKRADNGNYCVYRPISPRYQHESVYYGLAKAAGADMANVTGETVGTYPDEQKSAIQQMLGISDLLAPRETSYIASQAYAVGDIFTLNGKLYKVTTAIAESGAIVVQDDGETVSGANAVQCKLGEETIKDVQVNGTSVLQDGVANMPVVGNEINSVGKTVGMVRFKDGYCYGFKTFLNGNDYCLALKAATESGIKTGKIQNTNGYGVIDSTNINSATFYGLAKAAGDTTQSQSSNAVGTYTDDAKAAIKSMIGVNVEDVQVNGTSIVQNEVANVPLASSDNAGVVKIHYTGSQATYGIGISDGEIFVSEAALAHIKSGTASYRPIVPARQHESVFYGLAKASGDTTQSASSNAVGTYTDNAKASIKAMLGIVDGSTSTVSITGTTPSITAVENTRYTCGEVSTLTITPPASGICIIRFTSGTTPTVLTATGVVWPAWFDATDLDANTTYEICITDGYGAVMSWAL